MNAELEIRRLLDVLPASGRMMTKLVSKPEQPLVVDSPFPMPWMTERPIWINFNLWMQLSKGQQDLLILRTASWLSGIKWLRPSIYHAVGAVGLLAGILQLAQGDAVGIVTAGGLAGIAGWQIWRENRSTQVELDADDAAIRVAVRRGYSELEAARYLLSAIEESAKLEGRPQLNFVELLRCQNLRSLAGLSPVGIPDHLRSSR